MNKCFSHNPTFFGMTLTQKKWVDKLSLMCFVRKIKIFQVYCHFLSTIELLSCRYERQPTKNGMERRCFSAKILFLGHFIISWGCWYYPTLHCLRTVTYGYFCLFPMHLGVRYAMTRCDWKNLDTAYLLGPTGHF